MKILVTGASGMLGATLVRLYQKNMDVYATGPGEFPNNPARKYLKFDLSEKTYDVLLKWSEPEAIIHCAAMTNVNVCEQNPEKALAVNGDSVKRFLDAGTGARLIYVSSDAVFPDNVKMKKENSPVTPANVYGKSKALGEQHLMAAGGSHCAIRTTLVGRNINPSKQGFVEWMLASAHKRAQIPLFHDAVFTPISIWQFAEELRWILHSKISGILHLTGMEPVSKFEFGMRLFEKMKIDPKLIIKASIEDFGQRAGRSKDQTLDSSLYESLSGRHLPRVEDTVSTLAEHFKV